MMGVLWPELHARRRPVPGAGGLISPYSSLLGWCPQCPLPAPLGPQDTGRGGKTRGEGKVSVC